MKYFFAVYCIYFKRNVSFYLYVLFTVSNLSKINLILRANSNSAGDFAELAFRIWRYSIFTQQIRY